MSYKRLVELLRESTSTRDVRERIRLLKLVIARAKAEFPEIQEGLAVLDRQLTILSQGVNWEAYSSYALAGRWDFIGTDENYFYFAHFLSQIDDITAGVIELLEFARKSKRNEILKELEEEVLADGAQ